ncbi:aldo/keto reductase [Desulfovibrio sp. JC022]|uniref:aldo/keto reductase n=1 Tax=Desulfovibrio sp. JC022 TaxID=2593642 RepID=UPI0013D5CAD2|nr:aldo/keto reductase [Desulfovibrio sp. JC022]NDV23233.1 aldo/keto reductase [Desulfovibrio sp. JC022]
MSGKIILKKLGNSDIKISSIGLGCMGLSEFYGEPASEKQGCKLIHHALDQGVNFFDTADMYGGGHNEKLLAKAINGRREEAVIATKFGIVREDGEYARAISGKPEYVRKACHESLRRLKTDYIDLYYIHRVDMNTPIEETIGEMSRLVEEGKIRSIGISEASAETLSRAHAVHPLSALQSEYSMLTRDPEEEILGLTRELGISFVPYSPICRGLLSNWTPSEDKTDFRNILPRFQGEAYNSNKSIAETLNRIAENKGCTLAQLSLAWVCAQGENIIPIPGTTKIKNLDSNIGAAQIDLDKDDLAAIEKILAANKVQGNRYTDEGMKGVNV